MRTATATPSAWDPELPVRAAAEPILARLVERSVVRGELTIGRIRLVLIALAAFQEIAAALSNPWARDPVRLALPLVSLTLGAVATLATNRALTAERRLSWVPWMSVTLDTLLVFGPGLSGAVWPRPSYPGQLHLAILPFFLLVIVGGGLRLSRPVLRYAIGLNVLAAAILLLVDARTGAQVVPDTVEDWLLWSAAFVGASFLAEATYLRTRHLVWEASHRVLEAERARQVLGMYVSPEVAAEALGPGLLPVGRRQPVAVLFSDLRGFTQYAEHLPPERLVAELNGYLAAMMEVIVAEGGVVDKFMGDAIMVVFGVHTPADDDAARAIRAAAAMQRALEAHNRERATRKLPPLAQGVGVHYGEVIVGNIGAGGRMQYTAIGDAVNLASRLEAATKDLGVTVLVSATAQYAAQRAKATTPALRDLGVLPIRGRADGVHVYALEEARR